MHLTNQEKEASLLLAVALVLAMAIFAYAFSRGLGLTDEGLTVYLLLHPDTPMPSMDHFVIGHLLDLLNWTVTGLRWGTAFVSLGTPLALALAVRSWIWRSLSIEPPSAIMAAAFALVGGLLCFTAIRPMPNYAFDLVVACNLFAVLCFAAPPRSLVGDAIMGVLLALVSLARMPVAAILLAFLFLFAWVENKPPFNRDTVLRALRITGFAATTVLLLWLTGLDVGEQFHLLRVMTVTSHQPFQVAMGDMGYGACLVAAAAPVSLAVAYFARQAMDARRNSAIVIVGVAVAVIAAVAYMLSLGFLRQIDPPGALPAGNDALKSIAPAIHICAMVLLSCRFLLKRHENGVLKLCLLLYFLCLLPEIGSNTGLWHRSAANMGSLFLMVLLVLHDAARLGQVSRGVIAPIFAATVVPVMIALYGSLITHPMAVYGSAFAQTVTLKTPAVLEGLRVAPQVARLQASLRGQLQDVHFDFHHEALLPGTERLGLAVLVGAKALGNGWYFSGYDRSEVWNCAAADLWLAKPPPRLVAIDAGTLQAVTADCLKRYRFPIASGQTLGKVSVLARVW